mmetsp:Transcript_68398/g.158706  ORF Transcript_68398/g.158706 Transcript_68398/m.158706 type:complete len:373 (+) Transcript_68398:58-1176(+)
MVFRCNTLAQVLCTTWCLFCLAMLGVATVVTHRAFAQLIPPVVDMPENLREGLDSVLNFDKLEESAAKVKNFSKQALSKCQITEPEMGCAAELALNPDAYNVTTEDVESLLGLDTHNVSAEVDGISQAFADVLDEIERVITDKYLGIEEFGSTGEKLHEMREELNKLKDDNESTPCIAITEGFCPIYKNANQLVNSTSEVQDAISMIIDNDGVETLEKQSGRLQGLHVIPYLGWVGALFYACFFCSQKAVTICRGGSCGACVAFTCHSVFFVVYFIICVVITGAALAGSVMARDHAIEKPFPGKPTLAELVDHIEVRFPEFYDVVLKDFILGLESVRSAFLLNTVTCIFLLLHTVLACCCGVYKDAEQPREK